MTDAGLTERALRRARGMVRRRGRDRRRRVCAAAARPSTSRSPAPSAPTSTPRWRGAPRTTRCSRSTSSTGSAGPGSCSATAAARNGSWPRSTPPATRPRDADRADALLLAAWIEASTGHLELARDHIAAATELADAIDDVDLQARGCYYLAYVVSHRRRVPTGAGADRSQPTRSTTGWTGRGTRPRTGSSPPGPRSRPATRSAASKRATRSSTGSSMVDDPWLHVRRDAMLGELARIQHRFDDAVVHLGRAAETSRRLGFLQTEAYQVVEPRTGAVPGRRLRDRRRHPRARDRQGRGDRRRAHGGARPGAPRPCAPRARTSASGRATALEAATAWHRAAGGGEQAALGECLLAAMDAADGVAGAEERLVAILERGARRTTTPTSRSSPSTRSPASPPRQATSPTAHDLVRGGRSTHGSRLALHHRPRPHRRHVGDADRLTRGLRPWRRDPRPRA